jgi:6-phosphogluconolactonase (cycloisomerase 2 family)
MIFHILPPRKSNALSINNNLQIRIRGGEKIVALSVGKKRELGVLSSMLTKTVGAIGLMAILVSCGSGSSPGYSYTIGGIVSGLAADSGIVLSRIVLRNSTGESLSISTNGYFSFLTPVNTGGAYTVTIETQPSFLSQICTINNGSGIVNNAPVSSVVVSCVIPPPQSVTVTVIPSVGEFAYVANTGSSNISGYTINQTTGALTNPTTVAAGTNPYSVTVDPSGNFAYVANMGDSTISGYTINQTTGALIDNIPGSPFPTGTAPSSITVVHLSGGNFAYVANTGDNTISGYTIVSNGALIPIPGSPFTTGTNPYSVTVAAIPSVGECAYVANTGSSNISGYTINSNGTLTPISGSPFPAGTNPYSVTVDPSGEFAYVANTGSNNISGYTIDQISTPGALIPIPASPSTLGSPFPAGTNPYFVTVTVIPSVGEFAYVANTVSNDIWVYRIDPIFGTLTSMGAPVTNAMTNPYFVTVDPSGKFAYVANTGGNTISAYSIDINGVLIPTTPVTAGTSPSSVTVDPSGKFACTANYSDNTISGYTINPSNGVLTNTATVAAGTKPY